MSIFCWSWYSRIFAMTTWTVYMFVWQAWTVTNNNIFPRPRCLKTSSLRSKHADFREIISLIDVRFSIDSFFHILQLSHQFSAHGCHATETGLKFTHIWKWLSLFSRHPEIRASFLPRILIVALKFNQDSQYRVLVLKRKVIWRERTGQSTMCTAR